MGLGRNMEHRIAQLELKLAEQEQTNAGLRADIKRLKEIQYGNRTECLKGFEHYEQKKKKFSGLLGEVITNISTLQDQQELLATKEELETLVDHNAAGMHASGSPKAPDLMVFSPQRSLISFEETVVSPAHSLADRNARSQPQPLQSHASRTSSPLLDVSNHEAVQSPRDSSEGVTLAKSSVSATERDPFPFVRITPPVATAQTANEDQTAQVAKKVRFDLSTQRVDSPPSDSGSEDPLAPNDTLRKKLLGKQARNIAPANKESPLLAGARRVSERRAIKKFLRRKPAAILDQFKDGHLKSDSEDEEQAPLQIQNKAPFSDSQDTEATIDLAERAVASLVEAATDGAATGARRSGRAPKPRDFGDVEVHGWKTKRVRRS
ncbi:hypothetical protein MBLNU13_g08492t2 [Cladosporium sp. NU13]